MFHILDDSCYYLLCIYRVYHGVEGINKSYCMLHKLVCSFSIVLWILSSMMLTMSSLVVCEIQIIGSLINYPIINGNSHCLGSFCKYSRMSGVKCPVSLSSSTHPTRLDSIRGMFEMNCLFLSGDFKFQVSPKVLISCPRSTPRG